MLNRGIIFQQDFTNGTLPLTPELRSDPCEPKAGALPRKRGEGRNASGVGNHLQADAIAFSISVRGYLDAATCCLSTAPSRLIPSTIRSGRALLKLRRNIFLPVSPMKKSSQGTKATLCAIASLSTS